MPAGRTRAPERGGGGGLVKNKRSTAKSYKFHKATFCVSSLLQSNVTIDHHLKKNCNMVKHNSLKIKLHDFSMFQKIKKFHDLFHFALGINFCTTESARKNLENHSIFQDPFMTFDIFTPDFVPNFSQARKLTLPGIL